MSGASLYDALGQVRVVSMESGRAVIEYQCGLHMCHSGGVAQGGFVAGWIDAAMAHVPMSLELKISYFAPTNPGLVIAEGWIESGKRTLFAEGRLTDSDGKVLAKGSSTIKLIDVARVTGMVSAGG